MRYSLRYGTSLVGQSLDRGPIRLLFRLEKGTISDHQNTHPCICSIRGIFRSGGRNSGGISTSSSCSLGGLRHFTFRGGAVLEKFQPRYGGVSRASGFSPE